MVPFWLFGILPLTVLLFNIYVIRQIKKSSLPRKWPKYLTVILLNVPAISYAAVEGLSFKLLHFQFLFGFSFRMMGYLGSVFTFGIPLGGLYWLWKVRQHKHTQLHNSHIDASHIGHELEDEANNTNEHQ
jgi:hypothetical protein